MRISFSVPFFSFFVVSIFSVAPLSSAEAGLVCGERADFVEKLDEAYGEKLISAGLEADGNVFEVYRSETGSWTILVTEPEGPTCVLASGEAWTDGRKAEASTDDQPL